MCCVVEEFPVSGIHMGILQSHNNYIMITTSSHDHCKVNVDKVNIGDK